MEGIPAVNLWDTLSGSWPRLLQKGWLVCLSLSSAASTSSSFEQFGVDGRGCFFSGRWRCFQQNGVKMCEKY